MADIKDKLIRLKSIALSDKQVEKMAGAKMILYKDLYKYKTIEELLDHHNGKVILLYISPHDDNFGHFTALIKTFYGKDREECIEWIDSYGYKPDEELEFSSNDPKHGQDFKFLSLLMLSSPYLLTYNDHKFQKQGEGINTCGWWASCRILNKDKTLKEFKKFIDDIVKDNAEIKDADDAVVVLMYDEYKDVSTIGGRIIL